MNGISNDYLVYNSCTYSVLDKAFPVSLGTPPSTSLTKTGQWRWCQNLEEKRNFCKDTCLLFIHEAVTSDQKFNLPAPNRSLTIPTIFSSDTWTFEFSSSFLSSQ